MEEELYCSSDGRLRGPKGGAIVAAGNQSRVGMKWMYDVVAGGGIVVMGGQKALPGPDVLSGCMYCHAGMYSMTLGFLDSQASRIASQNQLSCTGSTETHK